MPMFVIAKKGIEEDGKNPTMLYGYGGFNVNQTPASRRRATCLLRARRRLGVAILRGGGEFGEDWHKAGMLEKQAERLRRLHRRARERSSTRRYTDPAHLGIIGGSNGGLLVAPL